MIRSLFFNLAKIIFTSIFYVSDLLFNLNNTESFDVIVKKIRETDFLVWTGPHYSVPNYLNLTIDNQVFYVMEKKSKHDILGCHLQ